MPDYNEFKGKVKDAIGNVADITRGFAGKAADRAKYAAKTAKLAVDINSEKDVIRRTYSEIGKLYYKTHRDDGDEALKDLCDRISAAELNVEKLKEERAELKAEFKNTKEADIEVEFEEVVARGEDEAAGPADECGK